MYNFSSEQPPVSLINDILSLNKFNGEQYQRLVSLGIDVALQPSKSSSVQTELEEFGETNNINITALKNVFKSFLVFVNGAVRKTLNPTQVKDDLVKIGVSNEKAEYFANQHMKFAQVLKPDAGNFPWGPVIVKPYQSDDKWQDNAVGLSRSALSQTLMVNQLVDMEWKFGVTASSSDLKTVGNTFLQLKLVINKGNKTENVYMELTLPQFYSFLHEMEKAKASLEYFS